MVGKNNKQIKNTKQGTKVESYSIKKFKVGAASVVIGASIFFGAGVAAAADTQENSADTNTTSEKTDAAASEEAPATVAQPSATEKEVAKEATTEEVAKAVENKTAKEEVKVDATKLTNFIKELEQHIEDGTYDNRTEDSIKALKEEIAKAKITAETSKDQATIDATLEKLQKSVEALPTKEVKEEAKAETTEATGTKEAEANEVAEAKEELQHIVTEAPLVTNSVAKEAEKVEDASAKAAITSAIETVNTKVTEAINVLKNDEATKDDVTKKSSELRSALEGVVVARTNAGINTPVTAMLDDVEGAVLKTNATDYISVPNGDGTYRTIATSNNPTTSTGKDIWKGTALTPRNVLVSSTGDISTLEFEVGSSQRDGSATNPGAADKGRVDYPLTPEKSRELAAEAPLWNGKMRVNGTILNNSTMGSGGAYEYLATHIYHLVYEQGVDRVYIPNFRDRFKVTDAAAQAGWTVSRVNPTNLANIGLTYNADSDTIEGVITTATLPNGVYDIRTEVTFTNTITGAVANTRFANLRAGWFGVQDTKAPVIESNNKVYSGKVGEAITTADNKGGIDIKYRDVSGSRIFNGPANTDYVLANGEKITIRISYANSGVNGISGIISTSNNAVDLNIPGLQYKPNAGSSRVDEDGNIVGYDGIALIQGTPTEAGIYYVTAYAKDFDMSTNTTPNNARWFLDGQEARAGITITIAPKIDTLNIATYSTEVPITISNGATYATVTMPDGTVTALENQKGKWIVAANGTTNTAVTAGAEVGTVGQQFNLKVNRTATEKAGVDNITVYAKTENVQASLMRNVVTLKDADGSMREATFNPATGRYELPAEYATVRTEHSDGTYDVTQREVYVSAQTDGAINYYIYAYNRTFDSTGKVTAVNDVTRIETVYAKDDTANSLAGNGMYITVKYDKATDTWTASDGSTVTATKNSENKWTVKTTSGYTGEIQGDVAESTDKATIINTKPTAQSTSYESTLNKEVNLIDRPAADTAVVTDAKVSIKDTEDDALAASTEDATFKANHKTKVTSITVKDPDGNIVFADVTTGNADNYPDATTLKLTKVGVYTVTVNVVDSNTNLVDGTNVGDTTSGTDHGANTSVAETVYTITVKANIVGTPATSTDIQGATQKGTPTFNFDDSDKTQITSETNGKKVYSLENTTATDETGKAVGKYEINETTGEVTFTPNPDFVGTPNAAKVTLTLTVDGIDPLKATAEYTPTVVGVKPVGTKVPSTDIQGATQTGQPTFTPGSADINGTTKTVPLKADTYKLLDNTGAEVADGETTPAYAAADSGDVKAGDVVGNFSIDKSTGLVTFTPTNKAYVGAVKAVQVVVSDENGTQPDADKRGEYTPNIIPVTPTAEASKTSGPQGKAQTSAIKFDAADTDDTTVNFAKGTVAIDDNTTKSVALDKSTVTLLDANGNAVETLKVTGKDGKEQGTYTLDKTTNTITFQPLADFVGPATPVTVQVKDANGTVAKTTYTPTVTDVTIKAEGAESTKVQGSTQTGTPTFETSDSSVTIAKYELIDPTTNQPATNGKVTIADVGTYTINDKGVVTFVPVASYVTKDDKSNATSVTVKATDENGESATATYTPTVTPVTAEGNTVETTNVQGQEQKSTDESKSLTYTVSDATNLVKNTDGTPKATYSLEGADATTGKVTVANEGTYSIDATTGKVTFVPVATFTGKATGVTVKATYTLETEDKTDNTTATITATAKYTPTVVSVKPTATESSTTGIQGAVQKSEVVLDKADTNVNTLNFTKGSTDVNGTAKSVDLDSATLSLVGADKDGKVTIAGQGTYTIVEENGTKFVQFTPEKSYTGDVTPVTVSLKDKNGTEVRTTYTPKIVGVKPIADASKTTGVQGVAQTSTIVYDEANNSDNNGTTLNFAKGSAVVNNETKSVELDKKSVKFVDASGNAVDTLTVANQGTYTLVKDTDGNVTGVKFTPTATFTGTANPVTVRIADANGTTAETTYTPSVTPLTAKAEPATSTGTQGSTQSGTPTYTAPTVDASLKVTPKYELDGADTDGKVVVPNVGTYTIDENGKVTFSPVAGYVTTDENKTSVKVKVTYSITSGVEGETPATVTAETTYTPTVNPVTSEGNEVKTTNIQGQTQKSTDDNKALTYTISDASHITKRTYAFEDGTTTKTVVNVGTYTVDDKGQVTFVPVATYHGTADVVTVVETATLTADDNSTTTITTKSTYQPTVTPVTIKSENDQSTNVQGVTQTGTPKFTSDNEKVTFKGYKLVDPTTGKPTDKTSVTTTEGTYTIDKDGKVTFVPKPDFVGKGSITVEATDSLGRTITANYTPETTPITVESTDAPSKDIQGKQNPQEGTPKFTLPTDIENVEVKEGTKLATVTGYALLDDKGNPVNKLTKPEGKYEIGTDGKVTFTPVNTYTGTPNPVTVQATVTITNANGETATITKDAKYTPTVVPVTPTAQESATAGKQGAKQVSPIVFDNTDTNTTTLNFNKGETSEVLGKDGKAKSVELVKNTVTLLDANGNPTTTVTVDGQGTYTLVKDSEGNYSIEFQPTPEYSGTATPVKVQVTDLNGTTVTTTYTPTVIAEDGSVVVEYIDKDTKLPIVPTETPVNNAKVTTSYTTTPKEIPGYKLVRVENPEGTTKDENGKVTGKVTNKTTTITYVYEKIKQKATLSYFDITTGKEVAIASAPSESVEGVTNGAIDFTNKAATIAALEKAGYEVTTDEFQAATTANRLFDNDATKDQNFKVLVKQRVLPVTPTTPNVTPGVPVTPEDPANWPESVKDLQKQLTKTVTRTIKYRYIDENGQEAAKDVVQTVTFTRNATVNLVTGEVKLGDWSAAQTLGEVSSPVIDGYTTTTTSVASATITPDSEDSTVYVIYNQVKGNVVVENYDTKGNKLTSKDVVKDSPKGTDYSVTPEAKIEVGGKTYYYKEVKADSEPQKGKVTDRTTTVKYVYEEAGSVVVNYTDKDGNVIKDRNTTAFKDVKAGTNYDTTKELRPETITTADGKTYKLVEKNNGLQEGSAAASGTVISGQTTEVTYVYEEVKTPNTDVVTKFVDEKGNPVAPQEKGNQPKKEIPGYEFVTTKDENGNTVHVYKKVTTPTTEKITKFVDEKGNPVANEEKGNQPKKEIPGYEFVTTKDEDGNTVHVYKKVTTPPTEKVTKFVDEKGNPVAPQEKGNQPKKEIPGYEFVTTKDENGNTVHVYKKVTTPPTEKITKFVDEKGNPVANEEKGKQNPKEIPGYELVRTYTDESGNTVHVYRKVVTPTPVTPAKPTVVKEGKQLPNTDATSNNSAAGVGLIGMVAAAIAARRKRNK